MTRTPRAARRAALPPWPARRRRRRTVVALVAGIAGVSAAAASDTHWDKDALLVLLREHAAMGQTLAYVNDSTDASYARWVFGGGETPYADLADVGLSPPDEATRRAIEVASTTLGPVTQRQLHDWKVWDLGYTKVAPMRRASVPEELRTAVGVPQIMKAGIDPDIYNACTQGWLDIGHPAIQANYALALQVLREKLRETNRRFWHERGLRADVIGRFLDPARHGRPTDFDLHYLIELLDGELSTWRAAQLNDYGFRQLPATFRLARIAAAYQEALPRDAAACQADGTRDPAHAGMGGDDGRSLCFADATDRGAYEWYARTLKQEFTTLGSIPAERTTVLQRLAAPLFSSSQGRIGMPLIRGMQAIVSLENVQMKVANQLLAQGQMSVAEGDLMVRNLGIRKCGRTP